MKQIFLVFLFSLFQVSKSFSQDVLLTQPRLEIIGNQFSISYDIISQNTTDMFYIWVVIKKANGEDILAKTISGDIGDNVRPGNNKNIIWIPEKDSIYLNEEIFVEIKAEKHTKSFNKGSAIFKSMVFPGWGQTSISKGKPWWITGLITYGTLAGSYISHKSYLKSYESYSIEKDRLIRADLLEQTQRQLDISTVMLYSAVSTWAVNVIWVALTPNKYKPLEHTKFSLNSSPNPYNGGLLLSLRFNF